MSLSLLVKGSIVPDEVTPNAEPSAAPRFLAIAATRYAKKGEFVSRNIAGETILVPVRGRMGVVSRGVV